MQLNYSDEKVYENVEISKDIYKLSIKGSFSGKPGQFYMLRCWGNDPLLSRPISIHDADDEKISFLYQVKGKGTGILKSLKSGDRIKIMGPLGTGFNFENITGRVALITGGIGIAPMIYASKMLCNCDIDFYSGFKDEVYMVDDAKKYSKNIYIATETGRTGFCGFVTEIFNPFDYSLVLCCGPIPMMEKVARICRKYATPVYLSMESNMACGIGACLGCSINTSRGKMRVCKDGPVFSGRDVIFSA
jgi:dihydroorotate dehydrogenase electron transfer subunit